MNGRNVGIEYLRVYASISVVVIHVAALAIRQTVSYSYEFPLFLDVLARAAVPIFFMISGYLLINPEKQINLATMWRKTNQRILLPLLFWLGVYWLFSLGFYAWRFQIDSPLLMSREFFAGVTTYHFWFLPVLGLYYLLVPWLNKQIQSWQKRTLIYMIVGSFVIGFLMQMLGAWSGFFLFQILKIIGFFGYFLFGYYVRQTRLTVPVWIGVGSYLGAMAVTALNFIWLYQFLPPSQTINYITDNFFPLIIVGSLLLFTSFIHRTYRHDWLNKIIVALSPYTFGVYFVHVAVLSILASFGEFGWFPMISNPLLLTISVFLISLLISYLMKKNRFFQRFI